MIKKIILAILLTYCFCAEFDITSKASCLKNSSGYCTQWNQQGEVIERVASCFPGDTQVMTEKNGRKKMSELKVNDRILTIPKGCNRQCQPQFTDITGWFHRQPEVTGTYLWIFTQDKQTFMTSPFHNIATEGWEYYFGKDLKGKKLLGLNQQSQVTLIKAVQKLGLFSPMTKSNTYLIFKGKSNSMVLAHSYAHIRNPVFYQPIVDTIIKSYEYIWGQQGDQTVIHPAAKWMMKTFSSLTTSTSISTD